MSAQGDVALMENEELHKEIERLRKEVSELRSNVGNEFFAESDQLNQKTFEENDQIFRNMIEKANDGICVCDCENRIVFSNKKLREILGYDMEEISGKITFDLMDEETKVNAKDKHHQGLKGNSDQYELKLYKKDNSEIWVSVASSPLNDKSGRIAGTLNIVTDLTQQKKNEQSIRQYAESLNFLSSTAMRMLGPMRLYDMFRFISDQLYSLTQGAIISFSEYDAGKKKIAVREFRCTDQERKKLIKLLGREPEGLEFDFPDEVRSLIVPGNMDYMKGGISEVTFGQLPEALCRELELTFNIKSVFAMACTVENEILGTIAILSHEQVAELENKTLIESIINQASLVLKRKHIEEELDNRATEIEAILNCVADGVIVCDKEGHVVHTNSTAEDTFGFLKNGKDINNEGLEKYIVWGEDGHMLSLNEFLTNRAAVNTERIGSQYYLLQVDGVRRWYNISSAPLIVRGVHSGGGVISLSDITERKQIENELRESEERFRLLADNIPQLAWIADEKGNIFWYSQRWYDYTGTTPEEMKGEGWKKIHHPDHLEQASKSFQYAIDHGIEWEATFPMRSKDGSYRWFLSRAVPVRDSNGKITRWFGTNTDITERRNTEEAIRENEQRLQGIFNNAAVGIVEADNQDRLINVNDYICQILGFKREELIGKSIADITAPEDMRHTGMMIDKIHTDRKKFSYEKRILKKDGSRLWVQVSISAVIDQEGNHIKSIAVIDDISERKQIETALIESKELFSTMFEALPVGAVLVTFPQRTITNVNQAWLEMMGYSGKEEAINKSPEDIGLFTLSSDLKNIKMEELAQKGHIRNLETVFTTNKGIKLDLSINLDLISIRGQKYILAATTDITERKHSEEALRESEAKLKLAMENGNIGVWSWDIEKNEIEWDERMERIFGIPHGTFGKTYEAFESFLVDEDIPHVRNAIRRAFDENIPFDTVYRIKILEPCEIRYISGKGLITRNEYGRPIKLTGVCFDITDMKKGAEKALFKLNEELLRSNKELGQFAYVASHDLQEPLRMVSSFTQLLQSRYGDKLDEDGREFIHYAVDGANRMYALINDLLAYSRVQTRGKEFSPVNMDVVFENAIYNLQQSIEEKRATVTKDRLPLINADGSQIIQLMQNLLGNAIKFNDKAPEVHVSYTETDDAFIFSIKDNGIGIESQYFERIFQIFQRLHGKDLYGGTGIGLAVCKRIVERHGGKIWVESEPGKGSVFHFSILKNYTPIII